MVDLKNLKKVIFDTDNMRIFDPVVVG